MDHMKGDYTRDMYYCILPRCLTSVVNQGAQNFLSMLCRDIDMKRNAPLSNIRVNCITIVIILVEVNGITADYTCISIGSHITVNVKA